MTAGRPATARWWVAGLTIALLILALAVDRGLLRELDHDLLVAAQRPSGVTLDWLMWALSLLGRFELTALVVVAYVLVVEAGTGWGRRRLAPLGLFALVTVVEFAAKYSIHQPAPSLGLHRGPMFGALGVDTRFAFPSGHMARLTLLLGLLALAARVRPTATPRVRLAAVVAITLAVGYSRVYLGEHWPADVAGGILLGSLGAALALAVSPPATSADAVAGRR